MKRTPIRSRRSKPRPCAFCEREFPPSRGSAGKFCSLKCWYDSKRAKGRTIRTCRHCGGTFENINPIHFCSLKCRTMFQSERRTETCKSCGKKFEKARPAASKKYCSHRCWALANAPSYRTFDCEGCGKEVTVRVVQTRPRRFCSAKCATSSRRGDASPLWRGNRRHTRGTNWPNQSALARERDGGRCCACGVVPTEKPSVDHIVPFRLAFRYGSEDGTDPNDLRNLISLCRSCHAQKTNIESRLLRGDVIGFRQAVARIMPLERVDVALALYRLGSTRGTLDLFTATVPLPAVQPRTGFRLPLESVKAMVEARDSGESPVAIALRYGISHYTSVCHMISKYRSIYGVNHRAEHNAGGKPCPAKPSQFIV